MFIFLNENKTEINNDITGFELKKQYKEDANLIIINGFPLAEDRKLKENDRVVFIKKGEIPSFEELEAMMMSRHTPGVYKILKNAKVAIAGLGGLGSNIAINLARIGVGELLLVDFDIVEPSNLNRQQYFIKHIGMEKCSAMKEIIAMINPYVNIKTVNTFIDENNTEELFKDVDVIIEAFDKPDCKATLVNTVLIKMKNKKIIGASGMAGYYSSNEIKTKRINSRFFLVGDNLHEAKEGNGLMAPRVAIAAGHMANMAVRIILDELEP